MKICPVCHSQNGDDSLFCTMCGNPIPNDPQSAPQSAPQQQVIYQPVVPYVDPYDHTAKFDPKDISDNKVYALAMYLLGFVGLIIALLGPKDSPYIQFHLRQNLKFMIVESLVALIMAVLFWTFIVPIVGGIALVTLLVLRLIAFFQICAGKAKEPAIIRSLGFLR